MYVCTYTYVYASTMMIMTIMKMYRTSTNTNRPVAVGHLNVIAPNRRICSKKMGQGLQGIQFSYFHISSISSILSVNVTLFFTSSALAKRPVLLMTVVVIVVVIIIIENQLHGSHINQDLLKSAINVQRLKSKRIDY
uniref:Uncharacterized protein n=1 Tax=Glossina brevipalpis TaxID=37001 RepID=A0A1A9WN47_9MUSC